MRIPRGSSIRVLVSLIPLLLSGVGFSAPPGRSGDSRPNAHQVGMMSGQSPALLELTAEQEDQILNAWRETVGATELLRKKPKPLAAEDRRVIQEAESAFVARREAVLTADQKALRKVIDATVDAVRKEVALQEKGSPPPADKREKQVREKERIQKLRTLLPDKVDEAIRNYWATARVAPKESSKTASSVAEHKESQ